MGTTTLNGWSKIKSPGASFVAPNGKRVYVRNKDIATIFSYIADRWHNELEPLPKATYNLWPNERSGYIVIHGYRPLTAAVGVGDTSNHHSGTAMDILGDRHHYERSCSRANGGAGCWNNYKAHAYISGFSQAQHNKLRQIAASVVDNSGRSVIRLGIDFAHGWRDAMHVEIAPGTSSTMVRQAADRIRKAKDFIEPVAEKITATVLPGMLLDRLGLPLTIAGIKQYQEAAGLVVDGKYGPKTKASMEETMKQLDEIQEELRKLPSRTISALMQRKPNPAAGERQKRFQYHDTESLLLYGGIAGLEAPNIAASVAKIEAAVGGTPERVVALIAPMIAEAVAEALPDQQADEIANAVMDALAKRLGQNQEETP